MRGHLVEQIKIIHFGGGQVKWGLLCGIQLWGIFSNRMKPFKFMCIQESQLFQAGRYSYCYKMLGYFTLRVGKNPGYDELLYTCADLVSTIHYADQLWGWSSFLVYLVQCSPISQTTSLVTLSHITRGDFSMMFRTPLSRIPINDLNSKASVQIIIFDLLLRCRNVCERSMPQSDGLCRSTKPPCILSTFSDPGP